MKRTITLATLATGAAIGAIVAACSSGFPAATHHTVIPHTAAPAAAPTTAPADTSPPIQPVDKVKFIVTGHAGASYGMGLSIDYGSDSDDHTVNFTGPFSGRWVRTVPFDPSAQFYSIDAQLSNGGSVKVKIVAVGPWPDQPLTVSHGHASGDAAIASAQAAPANADGTSWDNEE